MEGLWGLWAKLFGTISVLPFKPLFNLLASAPPPYRVRAQASILVHGHHPHVSVIDERAVTGGLNYQSQAP